MSATQFPTTQLYKQFVQNVDPPPALDGLGVDWEPKNVVLGELFAFGSYNINSGNLRGVTSLTLQIASTEQGWDFEICPDLLTLAFPNLKTIRATSYAKVTACDALRSVVFPSLTKALAISFAIDHNPSLIVLELPQLIEMANAALHDNASLVHLVLPNWVPTNGKTYDFSGNALDATSVNGLLARCVANAAFVSGVLKLTGGTNAAPTGQGITDAAELDDRGVTVTTN